MTMSSENIPSRSQKVAEAKAADGAKKKFDLSGKYRVREGYKVAYGSRKDDSNTVGHHPVGVPGEIIELTHEEAMSTIKLTTGQKNPETGRMHGPAIETEEAYNARLEAERTQEEFLKQLTELNPVL